MYRTVECFVYGTTMDLQRLNLTIPPKAIHHLNLLSLVSLAGLKPFWTFDELAGVLGNVDDIEELLICASDIGLLRVSISQSFKSVEMYCCGKGRAVQTTADGEWTVLNGLDLLLDVCGKWKRQCDDAMMKIDERISEMS